MRTVYKYELTEGVNHVHGLRSLGSDSMEHGTVRHVGFDPRGVRCVWIEVETDLPTEPRAFVHFGTGHPIPEQGAAYRGTYLDGSLVLHVYEVDPKLVS